MRRNRYLEGRMRETTERDGRRKRDSRGRYVRDSGYFGRDTERERDEMMYGDTRSSYNRGNDYGRYPMPPYPPMDYGRDYGEMEDDYEEDLKKWCKDLKRYDRFGLSKEDVITQAKNMGVRFKDYDEEEFITTYYMMMSDYPEISSQYQSYLAMAKQFLEDEDAELKGSEKLCAYMYTIVKGE